MSPDQRPSSAELLRHLTFNDSWIKATYVKVGQAGREVTRFNFEGDAFIERANKLQQDIISSLPCGETQLRPVSAEKVTLLTDRIQENEGGILFMRHGIQFVEDAERDRLTGSPRKIRLMQAPFNEKDPAAAQSLAEAASLALVLQHIGKKNNLPVSVVTSRNTRAADIGAIISVVNGFQIGIDDRLTCVNYPIDRTDEELEEMLGRDSMGALVWKEEILDAVCGDGTFKTIQEDVRAVLAGHYGKKEITVCITHTPQTNAADVLVGDVPIRMPELGFRLFSGDTSSQFINNVLEDNALSIKGLPQT